MTIQAIFTNLIEVHEITVLIILLLVMWMVYMLGYYHAQLDVMNHWLKTHKEESAKKENEQQEKGVEREVLLEKKRSEPTPTEKLDEELRQYLLRENANI